MNSVPRHVLRLLAIGALTAAAPQLASASDFENGTPVRMAMGPMSAAQKNQATTAKPDDVASKLHHRTSDRHKRHT